MVERVYGGLCVLNDPRPLLYVPCVYRMFVFECCVCVCVCELYLMADSLYRTVRSARWPWRAQGAEASSPNVHFFLSVDQSLLNGRLSFVLQS